MRLFAAPFLALAVPATLAAQALGLAFRGSFESPIVGAKKGNVEIFLHFGVPA